MNTPILFALLALLCGGITAFFSKVIGVNQGYSPSYMIVQAISFVAFAVIIHLVQKHPFELSTRLAGIGLVSGIFAGVATLASLMAFRLGGQGSIIFPIVSLGVIVSVALSFFVYREPITSTKLIGIGFGVASIVFLSR
ncbi:MAG: hypothetical protein CL789_01695 [Chloroflexi bacterium]|nr:hypothetical protein [Chloroflexota bacterium]HCU81110.1 hypothetical protein [Chloroflexota bacterium]|tara:strand:+ start:903 stop:1319 length:417 start_codon:yes stop_codon:yes gene_type:complete